MSDDIEAGPSTQQPRAVHRNKETERSMNFRRRQGQKFMQQHAKFLDDELFADFKDTDDYCNTISFKTQPRSVEVPIAVRGVGIMVNESILTVKTIVPNVDPPVPALYRTALAHVEQALVQANSTQPEPSMELTMPKIRLPVDDQAAINSNPRHFTAVVASVNQIGNFNLNDTQFYPRLTTSSHRNVVLSNLRDYVERMANLETPDAERAEGYALNSIPTAVWQYNLDPNGEVNVQTLRIANADQIIPNNYDLGQLLNDFAQVNSYFERICRKVKRFVSTIKRPQQGNQSQLVSTRTCRGSQSTIRLNSQLVNGLITLNHFEGRADEWHVPRHIPQSSCVLGALSLFGESDDQDNETIRSTKISTIVFDHNWHNIITAVLA